MSGKIEMAIAKINKGKIEFENKEASKAILLRHEGKKMDVSFNIPKSKRSLAQNRLIHSIVSDLSFQLEYPEGSGMFRSKDCWKDIIAAGVKVAMHELEVVPVPESAAVVVLGLHTSKMSVKEMGDFVEYAYAYGSPRGVCWSKTSIGLEQQNRKD